MPDIICLSKSLSGFGLPLSLNLIKPEFDIWQPGEHNGTFRGNNLAFITATAALKYWENDSFSRGVINKGAKIRRFLEATVQAHPEIQGEVRGRGLMQGIACGVPGLADRICAASFDNNLIMETSGPDSEVMKLMPPLTIDDAGLDEGLNIIETAILELKRTGFGAFEN
jgi:diaminobutyrate-2-oxoglutarate transaminase